MEVARHYETWGRYRNLGTPGDGTHVFAQWSGWWSFTWAAARARGQKSAGQRLEPGHEGRVAGGPARPCPQPQASQDLRILGLPQPGGPVLHHAARLQGADDERVAPPPRVRRRAGPGVPLGPRHQTRSHGIAFHVPDGLPEVLVVERAGIVSALPQMPRRAQPPVDVLRVPQVDRLEGGGNLGTVPMFSETRGRNQGTVPMVWGGLEGGAPGGGRGGAGQGGRAGGLPRWVTWCGTSGITMRAMRGMASAYPPRPPMQVKNMGTVPRFVKTAYQDRERRGVP